MIKNASKRSQRGSYMLELSMGLIVVVLLIVGVLQYFKSNSTTAQINSLSTDMTKLVGKVKGAYSGNYGNLTNAKLSSGGFFKGLPSLTDSSGTVVTGLGGGTLTVAPGTVSTANDSAQFTLTQVPDDGCQPLVSQLSGSVTSLKVGNSTVKAPGTQADPSKATCSGDNNTIVFNVQ
ncbi:type 4 pilus major pilin [Flavobacterium sp.]|uniref:type 4 pilus major pilin n=1 Tax=Flavobacterium sp. TaxID=239 RepID=UPI002610571B|nr:type 4 pilus major pilin [Flavobacterium sp.]